MRSGKIIGAPSSATLSTRRRIHQRWTATTHIDGDAKRQSDQLLRLAGAPSTVVITVRPHRTIQDRAHDFEAAIDRRSGYARGPPFRENGSSVRS